MSVNVHTAPSSTNTTHRSRCLWLKFKAKTLLVFGLRARAHEVFVEILSINPEDVLALNSLGYAHLNKGEIKQALVDFQGGGFGRLGS
jgi:Flp pilus assembly protein TadD